MSNAYQKVLHEWVRSHIHAMDNIYQDFTVENIDVQYEEPWAYSEYTAGGGEVSIVAWLRLANGKRRTVRIDSGTDDACLTLTTLLNELLELEEK